MTLSGLSSRSSPLLSPDPGPQPLGPQTLSEGFDAPYRRIGLVFFVFGDSQSADAYVFRFERYESDGRKQPKTTKTPNPTAYMVHRILTENLPEKALAWVYSVDVAVFAFCTIFRA